MTYADDVYLKNGFVLRNIQVVDTTNGRLNYLKDGTNMWIDTTYLLKIDFRELLLGQKSSYELFSKDLQDQYLKTLLEMEPMRKEREEQMDTVRADSLQKMGIHFDSLYSWRRSVYVAGGWGTPQGFRFELGYNFGEIVALALSFGIGDKWSRDPEEGTLAIIGSIRLPIRSFPFTPYLLFCRGGTFTIFGGSDTYTLIYLGAMVELRSGIHLRPELGLALTSKHISGGTSLFGGTSPEVNEDRSRLGANVTLEIDLAHLY